MYLRDTAFSWNGYVGLVMEFDGMAFPGYYPKLTSEPYMKAIPDDLPYDLMHCRSVLRRINHEYVAPP